MSLPEQFSEFEHLQNTYFRVHNRLVREEFSDVGGEDWSPSIGTPRGSLRHACTIKDNDTDGMIQMRSNLFFFHLRKAQDLQSPVYGIPIWDWQATRRFKPQIMLYFSQDNADLEADQKSLVRAQISFRLMNQTTETLSKAELTAYANRVKTNFGVGNGYLWNRGRNMATYTDPELGYGLKIQTDTKANAKDLINQVLDIQLHTFKGKSMKYVTEKQGLLRHRFL